MKIYIDMKPIIKCRIGLRVFMEILNESGDLERAFKDSARIHFAIKDTAGMELDLIYRGLDWGTFFRGINLKREIIEMKAYKCKIVDGKQFIPKDININTGIIELEEENYEKVDFFVTSSVNPRLDQTIEYMLGNNFVNKKWNIVVDLTWGK